MASTLTFQWGLTAVKNLFAESAKIPVSEWLNNNTKHHIVAFQVKRTFLLTPIAGFLRASRYASLDWKMLEMTD
jgi:hypothetical protein